MSSSAPSTPLLDLLRALTPEQRDELAAKAGTTVSYLYSLAGCQRTSCRVRLASRIAQAATQLHNETAGLTPLITMEQLATMCCS